MSASNLQETGRMLRRSRGEVMRHKASPQQSCASWPQLCLGVTLESFNGIRSNAGERAEPGTRVCNGGSEIGQRHQTRLSGGLIVSHIDSGILLRLSRLQSVMLFQWPLNGTIQSHEPQAPDNTSSHVVAQVSLLWTFTSFRIAMLLHARPTTLLAA